MLELLILTDNKRILKANLNLLYGRFYLTQVCTYIYIWIQTRMKLRVGNVVNQKPVTSESILQT
jgi:hypothetical protein